MIGFVVFFLMKLLLCIIGTYQAILYPKEDISDKKYYIGVSSTNFKIRYGNHKYSFPMSIKKIKLLYQNIIGIKK